jgi:hypothetical protein
MCKIILNIFLLGLITYSWAYVNSKVDNIEVTNGAIIQLHITKKNNQAKPDLSNLLQNFSIAYSNADSNSNSNNITIGLIPKNSGVQIIPPIHIGHEITNPIIVNVIANTDLTPT